MKEQKKKTARRWLGLLLAFVLVFTGSGMMILAQETAENSYTAVQNGLSEEPIDETEWSTELETADETEWSTELETADETEWSTELETADETEWSTELETVDETELGTEGFYGTANLSLDSSEIMPFAESESRSIVIKVVWEDNNDQDGIRPIQMTVTLEQHDNNQTKTLDTSNEWCDTFLDVSRIDRCNIYIQSVDEYTMSQSQTTSDDGTTEIWTYTFTHTPETKTINGRVEWDDNDDQDGKRPDKVTVRLYVDGRQVDGQIKEVTADDDWSYVFQDLPVYAKGSPILYTVEEEMVDGYTTMTDNSYTITNSHTPETTSISGTVTWLDADNQAGCRPQEIKVQLLANNVQTAEQAVTADMNWQFSFDAMPKYAEGTEISYTITTAAIERYATAIQQYDIINTCNRVKIQKIDQSSGKPLAGAVLQLCDSKGVAVAQWTSSEEAYEVLGLKANETYTLKEITAPQGYISRRIKCWY